VSLLADRLACVNVGGNGYRLVVLADELTWCRTWRTRLAVEPLLPRQPGDDTLMIDGT
jgi:hypothetical protein